jgi:hypothetical protein
MQTVILALIWKNSAKPRASYPILALCPQKGHGRPNLCNLTSGGVAPIEPFVHVAKKRLDLAASGHSTGAPKRSTRRRAPWGTEMNDVVQALTQHELLAWAWRLVVWATAAYLLILGALVFIRPPVVHQFFGGLASSNRVNFLEAALRLVVGLAFMAVSLETKLPLVLFWFGVVLAATAIPMMFLYRLHKRQAVWVIPLTKRILPLMGVVAIALGALIVWAVS